MLRQRSFFSLMVFFLITLSSYGKPTFPTLNIWDGSSLERSPAQAHKKVKKSYGLRVTEVTNASLELFKPEKPNGVGIIVSPGGAYKQLAIDKEGYEVAEYFAQKGYTVFVLSYSVPQKKENALQDIQRAIRLVKHHAEKWSLEKDSIGLLGFSAGGHLSAMAALKSDQETYAFSDDIDKESAQPAFAALIYPAYLDKDFSKKRANRPTISESLPPLFVSVSSDDQYVKSSLALSSKLLEKKVNHHFHLFPEGGHGYGLRPSEGGHAAVAWPELCSSWLEKLLLSNVK